MSKKEAECKNYYYCLAVHNSECTKDLFGRKDCENCKNYGECKKCGRKNTSFCKKCTHGESEKNND
jgi:hypothetical protein